MKTLAIVWQRLVLNGLTCDRCNDTNQAIQRAIGRLKEALNPLGIEPTLETREIAEEAFKANPSESNRIWIAGRPLEAWIDATTGSSRCGSVCGESECRTVEVEGAPFEAIPEDVFVKAALAAAEALLTSYAQQETPMKKAAGK